METQSISSGVPRSFRIVGVLALIWNAFGIFTYLMSVTMGDEVLASMSEAERALYTDIPLLVTSAYAIAVFAGTLGSVGLLMRKAWCVPVFILSLAAILVQMGHALFISEMIAVRGIGAAVLPVLIVVVAALLVWYSREARAKGWLG